MSRITWVSAPERVAFFAYWTITIYGKPFQTVSAKNDFFDSPADVYLHQSRTRNPGCTTGTPFNVTPGLGCSHFARRY